jgi:GTPase SAR1 family protein
VQLSEAGNLTQTPVREALEQCLAALRQGGDVPRQQREALEEKLACNAFNLVAVGQFKRGKTSVINALIGEELLPTGVVPLTSIVTLLSYGERLAVTVHYEDGRKEDIARERLREFVTETGNPGNEKRVGEVTIAYPSVWLKAGVKLVDTPGIGSVYEHNTDVAQRFLPKADAVLFLLSVEQPASQAERDYLKEVAHLAGRVFVLMNKADLVSEPELRESVEFTRRTLAEALGPGVRLFPVSARLALDAHRQRAEKLLQRSGFPAFSGALRTFLSSEREEVFLRSVARSALRLVSQARFGRELQLKALSAPLEELEQKLQRFQVCRQELLGARDEHVAVVRAEQKKLLREVVEKDLEVFEAALVKDIAAQVERQFEEKRGLPGRKLAEMLHQQAVEEIRRRFDAWRQAEDEKVSSAFRATCERMAARLDKAVDELYRFAADLFAVRYEAIRAEALWSEETRFRYKFWEAPGSLHLLASSAVLALPRFIGDRMILRRARDAAVGAARTQSGRSRYDFQQRLERSTLAFESAMLGNVASVLEGLDRALNEGAARQRSGQTDAAARRQGIRDSLDRLERAHLALEGVAGPSA